MASSACRFTLVGSLFSAANPDLLLAEICLRLTGACDRAKHLVDTLLLLPDFALDDHVAIDETALIMKQVKTQACSCAMVRGASSLPSIIAINGASFSREILA